MSRAVLAFVLALGPLGCVGNAPVDAPALDAEMFLTRVQPVLAARCATPNCHGADRRRLRVYAPGLFRADPRRVHRDEPLTPEELRANLRSAEAFALETAAEDSLLGALSILPEYLRTAAAETGAVIDYRDWQIPLGRRFRALKLWFTIRAGGADDAVAMIRRHVALTQQMAQLVAADDRFEVVAPHPMNLLCIRLKAGDAATDALIERANATGQALFTRTVLDGMVACRVSIGGRTTEERHVIAAWELLQTLSSGPTAD